MIIEPCPSTPSHAIAAKVKTRSMVGREQAGGTLSLDALLQERCKCTRVFRTKRELLVAGWSEAHPTS